MCHTFALEQLADLINQQWEVSVDSNQGYTIQAEQTKYAVSEVRNSLSLQKHDAYSDCHRKTPPLRIFHIAMPLYPLSTAIGSTTSKLNPVYRDTIMIKFNMKFLLQQDRDF